MLEKRDHLMQRKMEIDAALRLAKIDLEESQAIAMAQGKFVPAEEYAAKKRNVAYLQGESVRLQFELRGDRKTIHAAKDQRGALFLQEFLLSARRILPKETYIALCKDAEGRLTEQHGGRLVA
jgi:hypothetical protein